MVKTKVYGVNHYHELDALKQIIAREAILQGLCDVGGIGNDIVVEETSNYFYHFTITVADTSITLTVSIGETNHKVNDTFARLSSINAYSDTPWSFSRQCCGPSGHHDTAMIQLKQHLVKLHEKFHEESPHEKA